MQSWLICFPYFETGSHYVVLAGLELTEHAGLEICLPLFWSAGIKGVYNFASPVFFWVYLSEL